MWFSEFHVRTLAERISPRIAPAVEQAVLAAVREQLPGLLMSELRDLLPEHTPKQLPSSRRARDEAIRAKFTGHNAQALAQEFGLNVRQVRRIVAIR